MTSHMMLEVHFPYIHRIDSMKAVHVWLRDETLAIHSIPSGCQYGYFP